MNLNCMYAKIMLRFRVIVKVFEVRTNFTMSFMVDSGLSKFSSSTGKQAHLFFFNLNYFIFLKIKRNPNLHDQILMFELKFHLEVLIDLPDCTPILFHQSPNSFKKILLNFLGLYNKKN